jgi:hypothetical protein
MTAWRRVTMGETRRAHVWYLTLGRAAGQLGYLIPISLPRSVAVRLVSKAGCCPGWSHPTGERPTHCRSPEPTRCISPFSRFTILFLTFMDIKWAPSSWMCSPSGAPEYTNLDPSLRSHTCTISSFISSTNALSREKPFLLPLRFCPGLRGLSRSSV